jgi:hypothetical protein
VGCWLGLALVLAPGAGAMGVLGAALPGASSRLAGSPPVLSLTPSTPIGDAPLNATVSATVSGGAGPFMVTVCFGAFDHTSPPTSCNDTRKGWDGLGSLWFAHSYAGPGNYSVLGLLTDSAGSQVGTTALIVVEPAGTLLVTASASEESGTVPLTVQFNETVDGGTPPLSLQWSFGDGSVGSGRSGIAVTHTYTAAGTFDPTLTVTDAVGHQVVRTLHPIVTAPANAPGFGVSSIALDPEQWGLLAVVVGTAVGLFVGLRTLEGRRLRREGNDLVEQMEESERRPFEVPPANP